jgi:hypothetical protein
MESEIHASRFVVGDRPFCVIDADLAGRNREFLNNINPDYFSYIARTHSNNLEGEHSQLTALTLRITYFHALESFLALLGAAIQAPDCVPGWLHKYWPEDLRKLVLAINREQPVRSKLIRPPLTWRSISESINVFKAENEDNRRQLQEGFAKAWKRFASEFLDPNLRDEYNSIKHGFRVSPGGFHLAIALEHEVGVAPPPEEFQSLGGSKFGTSFFRPEPLDEKGIHFRIRRYSRNWDPSNMAHAASLLAISIHNVREWLRLVNGSDPKGVTFRYPKTIEAFDEPWKRSVGTISSNMDVVIEPDKIRPYSKEEILNAYDWGKGPDRSGNSA